MSTAATSVIIVNFNSGVLVERCVLSVLASTYPAIKRIIVSDNGSTDESLRSIKALVEADDRVKLIENGANIGFAAANNRALPFVEGAYILFLNPDCVIEAHTLARMAEILDAQPEAGMAGCLVCDPDGSEQRGSRRNLPTPARALQRVLGLHRIFPARAFGFDLHETPLPPAPVEIEAISGAFMFVRRRALDAVGPMDENYFLHCEDLDWCMRFNRAGWKILFVPDVRAMHEQGASSRATPIAVEYQKHRGMLRYYNKFYRDRDPWFVSYLVTISIWLRFVAKAAWIKIKISL